MNSSTPTDKRGARKVLDVEAVYQQVRAIDPSCSLEAVAEYVREINEMAGELYAFVSSEHADARVTSSGAQGSVGS